MFGRENQSPHDEFQDFSAKGVPARGRGASTLNPGNRFESFRLHVLGEHIDEQRSQHPNGIQIQTQALCDSSRTIINQVVDSPDIPFQWSINPYRGCEHGCIYCYARPTHETLGFSSGLDFESKIMVKENAAELLREELSSPKWQGEPITMSGVTDCYQPLEAKLKITRSILEIFAQCNQPVCIITKNHLVTRDIDLISRLANVNAAMVAVSVTTLDQELAMTMEPRASSPRDRLRALRELTNAGIPTMVMTAPIIPGLNDREIPALLEAAAEAGAVSAGWTMLRLPYQIKTLFLDWLMRNFPEKAARIEHLIREMRSGNLSDPRFGSRMRGEGEQAKVIGKMHKLYRKRFGLDKPIKELSSAGFRPPLFAV
jgi:DNA repair photolyase